MFVGSRCLFRANVSADIFRIHIIIYKRRQRHGHISSKCDYKKLSFFFFFLFLTPTSTRRAQTLRRFRGKLKKTKSRYWVHIRRSTHGPAWRAYAQCVIIYAKTQGWFRKKTDGGIGGRQVLPNLRTLFGTEHEMGLPDLTPVIIDGWVPSDSVKTSFAVIFGCWKFLFCSSAYTKMLFAVFETSIRSIGVLVSCVSTKL